VRKLGWDKGVQPLLRLWCFASQYKCDGNLGGVAEDIELAAHWQGEPGEFVRALLETGWLDQNGTGYLLHDWEQHNPWAFHAKERSERSREAAQQKWKSSRRNKATRSERMVQARAKGNHTEEEWQELRDFFGTCVKCRGKSGLKDVDRDHIIPVYQGGSHGLENIQPLCAKCNSSKGPDSTDYRVLYCQDNDLAMPAKWLRSAGVTQALRRRKTPAPNPFPIPSPNPNPLPEQISEESWKAFVEMRIKTKHPLTDRAITLIKNELQKLSPTGKESQAILDQSSRNDWRDVYPVKEKPTNEQKSVDPASGDAKTLQPRRPIYFQTKHSATGWRERTEDGREIDCPAPR
jgi:5-methylcytosine-specific restriction endonuclease McrA